MPTFVAPPRGRTAFDLAATSSPDFLPENIKAGFGGVRNRYAGHAGGINCFLDPVRRRKVVVTTALHYDNWLLRFLDPRVIHLEVPSKPWRCLHLGKEISERPDLHWCDRSEQVLEVVARDEEEALVRAEKLQRIAAAHGMTPRVRTARVIRANPVLLGNLEYARHAMVLQATSAQRMKLRRQAVFSALMHGWDEAVGTLRARLTEFGESDAAATLDSTLFWMHQRQIVRVDLTEVAYGDRSRIKLV